ncbi:hypothetical protein HWV62_3412 [Athelia sp. TMB]|nr:hypothetical protein HWV62_14996 [Athelia sp. TMB]KAF7977472.1 hypothetical protein HWV62_3412 [Athelia sp. TMB]
MVVLRLLEGTAWADATSFIKHHKAPPPAEEISKCYGIPYGAFGFISHVITFYTLVCAITHKRWYAPWKDSSEDKDMGCCFGCLDVPFRFMTLIFKLMITIALSAYTIYECRGAYRLLAVWKLLITCFDGATEKWIVRHENPGAHMLYAIQFVLLFIPGVGVGIAGIKDLAEKYWHSTHSLHTLTWVFVGVFSFLVVIGIIITILDGFRGIPVLLGLTLLLAYLLGTAYADWVIGIVARNVVGVPDDEVTKVVSGLYFAAKHLDMLAG